MKKVMILIGTRKGGFLAFSDPDRKKWNLKGLFLKGTQVHHVTYVGGDFGAVCATVKNEWWGPDVRISKDLGETWLEPTNGVRFAEGRELSVARVWMMKGDQRTGEPILYAGADPGALFKSGDGGQNWEEVRSLTEHPTRNKWHPGAGGMMVHSICLDPENRDRMFVGISAAGVFRTDDGGKTWTPKNKGVRTDFLPDKFPRSANAFTTWKCTRRTPPSCISRITAASTARKMRMIGSISRKDSPLGSDSLWRSTRTMETRFMCARRSRIRIGRCPMAACASSAAATGETPGKLLPTASRKRRRISSSCEPRWISTRLTRPVFTWGCRAASYSPAAMKAITGRFSSTGCRRCIRFRPRWWKFEPSPGV